MTQRFHPWCLRCPHVNAT